MMDKEFQIVKMLLNEILTEDTSQPQEPMNCTISQIQRVGCTNRLLDQQPVVLLNSVYQLLNYVINEQLENLRNQLTS